MSTRKLDALDLSPLGDGEVEVVVFSNGFDLHFRESLLYTEHLEVALIEEAPFSPLKRIENEWNLLELKIVTSHGRHFKNGRN